MQKMGQNYFRVVPGDKTRNSGSKFKQISFGDQGKFPGGKSYSTIKQIAFVSNV